MVLKNRMHELTKTLGLFIAVVDPIRGFFSFFPSALRYSIPYAYLERCGGVSEDLVVALHLAPAVCQPPRVPTATLQR
jgi:hypothetical protein